MGAVAGLRRCYSFGEPLDKLDAEGRIVPTHRSYRDKPPSARVDYQFVASTRTTDSVMDFGRHDRFWRELAWPAEGKEKISEHTPLWLQLRV